MSDSEFCPLCGVPLDDAPGPVVHGTCPVHGVIGRMRDAEGDVPEGLLGQETGAGLATLSADFGATLEISGVEWQQVDVLDLLDEGSEKAHAFDVRDQIDSYRSRQKGLRYPDGAVHDDEGWAHEGGAATWTIQGLTPGRDTLIVGRTDVMYVEGELALRVEKRPPIVFPDFAADRRYRWRNRAIPIPGDWIEADTLTVSLERLDSTKDLSHFRYWIYQRPVSLDAPSDGSVGAAHDQPTEPDSAPEAEPVAAEPVAAEPVAPEFAAAEPDPEPALEMASEPDPVFAPTPDPEPASPSEAVPSEAAPRDAAPNETDEPADEPAPADVPAPADDPALADAPAPEAEAEPPNETIDIPASALLEPQAAVAVLPAVLETEDAAAEAPEATEPLTRAESTPPTSSALLPPEPTSAHAPLDAAPSASADAATGAATGAQQRLVTISLSGGDDPHGTVHEHLADALAAGWRIARLEGLTHAHAAWLLVLLERAPAPEAGR